ncbi:ParA family protein [Stutzerimonas zhaodongensis]|uniref:ParA family protein n=1 Tax=Stutzerimonas zhaodongensis TaxID=1176257 RepID=UPI002104BB9B|nr:ParA family protein [Stutzerimonas zhaodongensis]MCQ2032252.1 ParA family protein [Stutzerimonas zhaodongensis]
MAQKVWLVASQKGGAGKTTIATALARHLSLEPRKPKVLLCDVDVGQHSSQLWYELRGKLPLGGVTLKQCAKASDIGRWASSGDYDHVVIDGAPHASKLTLDLAMASDVVVLPTWTNILSMQPTVKLANELVAEGVDRETILFTIVFAGSDFEVASAQETIAGHGYQVSKVAHFFSTSYGSSQDKGLTITESPFASLREQSKSFIKAIADLQTYKVTGGQG